MKVIIIRIKENEPTGQFENVDVEELKEALQRTLKDYDVTVANVTIQVNQ